MYVKHYLKLLVNSEIQNLAVSKIDTTEPVEAGIDPQKNAEKLIGFIGLAYLEICKRFSINNQELYIDLATYDNQPRLYDLPLDVLALKSARDTGYNPIYIGLDSPVNNDFNELPNTPNIESSPSSLSIHTPEPFKVRISGVKDPSTKGVVLTYIKGTSNFTIDSFIDLPETYTQAIIYFVANKAHKATKPDENNKGIGSSFWYNFLSECNSINKLGLDAADGIDNSDIFIQSGLP